jgi:hypothetical protein
METIIRVKITEDFRRRILRRTASRARWLNVLFLLMLAPIFGSMLLALLFSAVGYGSINWSDPMAWLPLIVVAAFIAIFFFRRLMMNKWAQSGWGDIEATYRITDEGLRYETQYGQGIYPWRVFCRLREYPDIWLLNIDRANLIALPADQLVGDVGEFILRKVRENGGKVKRKGLWSWL